MNCQLRLRKCNESRSDLTMTSVSLAMRSKEERQGWRAVWCQGTDLSDRSWCTDSKLKWCWVMCSRKFLLPKVCRVV